MDEQSTIKALVMSCIDCDHDFVWSVREQKWYAEQEFEPPKRCPRCRVAKRARFNKPYRQGDGEVR